MQGRTDSRWRILALLLVIVLGCGGLMARLVYWQVGNRQQELTTLAHQTSTERQVFAAQRGTIYDRTGTIILAQSIFRDRLVAAPHDLTQLKRTRDADALVDYLSLHGEEEQALRATLMGRSYYAVLATDLDPETSKEIARGIADGGLPGISLEPQAKRIYPQAGGAPNTSLAAHLLGFVNASGRGQYGIEQEYDEALAGKPRIVEVDASAGADGLRVIEQGSPGQDIRTTIDVSLQLKIEQEVFSAWVADRAEKVTAVVMAPKTGEILAAATYPSYDANEFAAVAGQDPSRFVDPIVSEVYEPGSVFKMLTASAALSSKTTALDTKINDFGVLKMPGGQEIADADRKSRGWMTFRDIVAWSRNVGVSQAAFRLGKTVPAASRVLYGTWKSYGIGDRTGIDLAGEVSGIVRDPSVQSWSKMDLANASFGQGVAVTPIQILRAYSAMANGGTLVTPHVALNIGSSTTWSVSAGRDTASQKAISASLSAKLTALSEYVVQAVPSYADKTLIPGYFVGGKTGTAQIWDKTLNGGKGDWSDKYNYSFYGWVGHQKPDVMIGTAIFKGTPTVKKRTDLDMPVQSYELFRRIATDSVSCLDIKPNPKAPIPPKTPAKVTPQG
jgi:cell division protein FtsI (penicillin-binding protein 3)/stage V sporulation protein D (sporulation-specific penicillin-binding protein)